MFHLAGHLLRTLSHALLMLTMLLCGYWLIECTPQSDYPKRITNTKKLNLI